MNFKKSQLMKTIAILRKKECCKEAGPNQVKRTVDKIRGKE